MNHITASLEIAAPPEAVWRILMDWSSYPEWNPTLRAIAGQPRKGAKITVSVASPVGILPMAAVLTRLVTNAGLTWHSKLPVSSLFDRDHLIDIEAVPGGSRVTQTQTFTGVLAPGASMVASSTVRDGLVKMNLALKERVEAGLRAEAPDSGDATIAS